ncbi:ORF147 [White spot syndrome virus]|uniref:ORF147 n=1 Tax=White spot syndrome virus TaxID=342409 RepID=A0A2D3I6X3_9VIRU|nr:ORF147 [White spot syndrome virus]
MLLLGGTVKSGSDSESSLSSTSGGTNTTVSSSSSMKLKDVTPDNKLGETLLSPSSSSSSLLKH